MPRALLALFTAAALVVSACGADEDDPTTEPEEEEPIGGCDDQIDELTVTGPAGDKPTIEFQKPFSVDESRCQILTEGDGEAAGEGDTVVFDFVFVIGRDGKEYGTSYSIEESASVTLDDQLLRGVRRGLTGSKAGSRVIVAMTPEDGYGLRGGDPAQGLAEDDTLIFVADVHEIRRPLERAEGDAVTPPAGLPTVVLGADGEPAITVTPGEPPAQLVVQPLIEGDGAVVKAGQTLTVHYTGVLYGTGEVFDTSWDGAPANFPIGTGGVIAGWDKGLVGQKVGSQILLVVPPGEGYGAGGQPDAGISGTDTLVFVVDILDARTP
ncbi:MAG: FKBP-type peptidyl-prolyl cis-trans isomerase [Acidimicrobiales bacterium]|nr:FKBP-type peptidyl-prolyl cis-trans isomerase [Acidimicrobiales bacterium]